MTCHFKGNVGLLSFSLEPAYLEGGGGGERGHTRCNLFSFPKLNIYSLDMSKRVLVKQVTHFPNSFMVIMLGNLDQSTYLINSLQDQHRVYTYYVQHDLCVQTLLMYFGLCTIAILNKLQTIF